MLIEEGLYKEILSVIPVLCVDLLVEVDGRFLLVKRSNEPLKGEWWVPGGRVLKGETLLDACGRKTMEELGVEVAVSGPVGVYEDFFDRNPLGVPGDIHMVSVVFKAVPKSMNIKLDGQSSEWGLFGAPPRRLLENMRTIS